MKFLSFKWRIGAFFAVVALLLVIGALGMTAGMDIHASVSPMEEGSAKNILVAGLDEVGENADVLLLSRQNNQKNF